MILWLTARSRKEPLDRFASWQPGYHPQLLHPDRADDPSRSPTQVAKVITVDKGSEPETLDAIKGAIERNRLQSCEFHLVHIDYEYHCARTTAARWQVLILPNARAVIC